MLTFKYHRVLIFHRRISLNNTYAIQVLQVHSIRCKVSILYILFKFKNTIVHAHCYTDYPVFENL